MLVSIICAACSKEFEANRGQIRRGRKYCSWACYQSHADPIIHGHARRSSHSKEYGAWSSMKRRCYRITDKRYERYGGRGIKVCDRWLESFENFLEDVGPAPSPSHSLGRIENNDDYRPGNVEWQSDTEQANNKSSNRPITLFGETHTVAQWCEKLGLKYSTVNMRLNTYGWEPERALSYGRGNQRILTFNGRTMTLTEWALETGIDRKTIAARIDRMKWSVEKALSTAPYKDIKIA